MRTLIQYNDIMFPYQGTTELWTILSGLSDALMKAVQGARAYCTVLHTKPPQQDNDGYIIVAIIVSLPGFTPTWSDDADPALRVVADHLQSHQGFSDEPDFELVGATEAERALFTWTDYIPGETLVSQALSRGESIEPFKKYYLVNIPGWNGQAVWEELMEVLSFYHVI
jgi:hypothetical protein